MKKYIMTLLCIVATMPALAQMRKVQGTVVDASGEPIIGATIRVEGADASRATVTDIDGKFTVNAEPSEKLRISFVGYSDAVVKANSKIDVTMHENAELMDEVVVVGYGTQKKATLTGAVSAIDNKEMTVTKNENVVNMLSGKIPGVRITQLSAQPGAADNKIDIRGMGTPLIIVDGIPRDQAYFSRMDANEIDNISVLKDASASIYGVRAANGVILVTTKHGSASGNDKFDVTFSANWAWQNFLYVPQTASATDHMLLLNEKYKNGFNSNYPIVNTDNYYPWEKILQYSSTGNRGTDWTDLLFDNNVPQKQYNVSVNGGSKKIDYFVNIGYMDQMGSYSTKSLNYNRWNFRSNVDVRITDRFKLGVQLSGYTDKRHEPYTDIWTVYKRAWTYRPTAIAYINGDKSLPAYDKSEFLENENPVVSINSDLVGSRSYKNIDFDGALTLQYDSKYVPGLSAKAFYNYDYSTTNNTEHKKTYYLYQENSDGSVSPITYNSPGTLRRSTSPYYGTMMQLSLNYNHQFGDHTVGGLILFEESYNNADNFYAQRSMNLASDYLFAGESANQEGNADKNGIWDVTRRAWVGRVTYDYQGKYMGEFAFREDGSSKWAKDSRWGFFPSVSVGWRASEEKFVKKLIPFLTNLKFRASYGEMGDDGSAGNYPPTTVGYNIIDYASWFYGNTLMTGVSPTAIPNPDLTWYKAKTYNFGVDWDLWNGMLAGTFELFQRKRSGLLETATVTLPGTVGAEMPQENMNSDKTFGWEFSVSHRNHIGKFNYWANAQISATKSRWDYKAEADGGNSYDNWRNHLNRSGRNKNIWMSVEEGGRFNNIEEIQHHGTTGANYGQGTLPGDYYYKDWNGDGIVNDDDLHPYATYDMPVFNYGFNFGADWRGIDFSMNWQGAAGVYGSYGEVFTTVGPFENGAVLDIYKDRWHTANVDDDPWNPATKWVKGYYPATGHSFDTYASGIRNTSYLRLKTIELGYTLPAVWTKFAGIESVRIYVNAYNLLTISGLKNMDPERPGNNGDTSQNYLFYRYPVNRTFNFGATVRF